MRWVLMAVVAGLGLWGALSWSLIPVSLNGRISTVEYYSDSGLRFMEVHLHGGSTVVVDRRVTIAAGNELQEKQVTKDAWSRTLHVGDRTVTLAPSPAFWQTAVALGFLCFCGLRPWRARPDPPGDG